jgi:hypothetical protein
LCLSGLNQREAIDLFTDKYYEKRGRFRGESGEKNWGSLYLRI